MACQHQRSAVFNCRPVLSADAVEYAKWRRRRCEDCGERWTTYEIPLTHEEFPAFYEFWKVAKAYPGLKPEHMEFLINAGVLNADGELKGQYCVADPSRIQRTVQVAVGNYSKLGQSKPAAPQVLHEVRRKGPGPGRA